MAAALLSVPTPVPQRSYTNSNSWLHSSVTTTSAKYPYKPLILLCSSFSSSSISAVEDGPSPPPPDAVPVQSKESDNLPFRGCKGCGKEEIERGCNGEGRIQGGIATFPGFGWWPIKAYRPCPGYVASGGRYRRQGQTMDEVVSGRMDRPTITEVESSKKLGGKKSKR